MILDVKALISITKYDASINGAIFTPLLTVRNFLVLILPLTFGIVSGMVGEGGCK
jgi:hypothetical protein